jgi:hypothetical protein
MPAPHDMGWMLFVSSQRRRQPNCPFLAQLRISRQRADRRHDDVSRREAPELQALSPK